MTTAIPMDSPGDIGRLVRSERKRLGMTQGEYAALCGVGRRFLGDLENGKESLHLGLVMQVLANSGYDLVAHRR